MRFAYQPENNDERSLTKSYELIPAEAETADTVTQRETLRHFFTFVIGDTAKRVDSDETILDILETLYDKLDQIFRQFVDTKMNMAGTVVQVDQRFIEAPVVEGTKVYLKMRFWVKYRQTLN